MFSDLGLGPELLNRIEEIGYTQPTPIQEKAIPMVLQGRDILGCAQTGTGKTASFTLPMIEILAAGRARARMPRSLILEPTRELAAQVAKDFEKYGKYHKLSMALLIGGESFGDQIKRLDRGVDVLIATPGRMIDLFERGNILLSDIKVFVIDEADRMLDMGFIPDIERIVSLLPKMRQTLFFSATMPPEIRRLADAFLSNPREITVAPPASPAATVTQALAVLPREAKRKALRRLLSHEDTLNALIFCNRKRDVSILHRSLQRHGFSVGCLHGDMPQNRRTETLEAFRNGAVSLLVCSDVAARGLDIAGLSHVFNFDVPINAEDYVHRIGRTGRAGRSGRAYTLATPDDTRQVAAIERLIQREIPRIVIDGFDSPALEEDEDKRPRRSKSRGRAKDREREATGERRRSDRSHAERPSGERGQGERAAAERGAADRGRATEASRSRSRRRRSIRDGEGEMDVVVGEAGVLADDGDLRPPREMRRRRRDDDDQADEKVIGFGDHIPAFMIRPARVTSDREV